MSGRSGLGGRPSRGALCACACATALALALGVSACDESDRSDAAPRSEPTAAPSPPPPLPDTPPVPSPEPDTIRPVAGRAERTVPWRLVRADGRRLVLEAQLGGPPCDALTRVAVRETAARVQVTLRAGRVPGARCGPGVAAMVGTFRVEVALRAPLGARRLTQ